MTKIAYYYNGNKEYINKLLDYELTILIDNDKYVNELLKYNVPIRKVKYDNNTYDIFVGESLPLYNINANKKVIITNYEDHRNKIWYYNGFDINKILEKPKKEDIKFSVIIPNYNNSKWINKTIESILNQTYTNWEMYIIDDMSTDNSIEVINQYKDKRITLIQNEIKLYNGGSRNVGILKAKKSNPNGYLLFWDSDDWAYNNLVLEELNAFIEDEDLITLDYMYYMSEARQGEGRHTYKDKDQLFMTIGAMCAVWCKCFKVSIAPLFEFNTLMEDRNYHYRLVNKCNKIANFGKITYVWNKMNTNSITTNKKQLYSGDLQTKIEWNNCAYRHIAGMLDLLNELSNEKYINFIKEKIETCKKKVNSGIYEQY